MGHEHLVQTTEKEVKTMDIVKETQEFLLAKLGAAKWGKPEDRSYRIEHSFRVANIAKEIAISEGMDADALYIGGLLHDVGYCEAWEDVRTGWLEHGRRSAAIARPFLESLMLDKSTVEDICYGIAIHVDDKADFEGKRTSFALSIGAADNIDRFDVYRIYEELEYIGFRAMPLDDKLLWLGQKASKLQRVLAYMEAQPTNPTADRILAEKLGYQQEFYGRLEMQLKNSK